MNAGELFIVGFEDKRAPDETVRQIAAGAVGGVILFARNLGTPDEIDALTRALHAAVPADAPPLIVAIDQEGGRVQRIREPVTRWPPMARVGARGDEALGESVGRAIGAEVAAFGFNLDFAPVLDVHSNPANPIIGDRAFSTEPAAAARQALAFWRGLESSGVRGCGKHFPGHGDTATDSHLTLPRVEAEEARLWSVELPPFVEAARAGVPMIMTAHVVYPAVDERPATMSRRWLNEILRERIGFRGVIVSDDLDMKAVADQFPVEKTVVESLMAGCDCFLACRDVSIQQRAIAALERAAGDPAVRVRLDESAARVRAFRQTLMRPPAAGAWRALPLADHAALVTRL
jgi:beta-N-acetylhexosaminidase